MSRGVYFGFTVVVLLLFVLAGCARMSLVERDPWRSEAEIACMQSGAVTEGPGVAIVQRIDGPGMCGADYPLRISTLGSSAVLGYADEVTRPPEPISESSYDRQGSSATRQLRRAGSATAAGSGAYSGSASGAPLSLAPPGVGPVASTRTAASNDLSNGGGPTYLPPPGYASPPAYGAPPVYPPSSSPPPQPIAQRPSPQPLGTPRYGAATGPAGLSPPATLACPLVARLNQFVAEQVQPAALRWFGQPVAEIRQISAYSCRGMNGDPNAKISEHAFGNALDIAAFTLADGRKISVKDGWHGAPEEQGFLHDVQGGACEMFTTVLAPGSNAFHYDHMHVDLMRRTSRRSICEPTAVAGVAAAARAAAAYGRARPSEPRYTGSVSATGRLARPPSAGAAARPVYAERPGLARAVPGAD